MAAVVKQFGDADFSANENPTQGKVMVFSLLFYKLCFIVFLAIVHPGIGVHG